MKLEHTYVITLWWKGGQIALQTKKYPTATYIRRKIYLTRELSVANQKYDIDYTIHRITKYGNGFLKKGGASYFAKAPKNS